MDRPYDTPPPEDHIKHVSLAGGSITVSREVMETLVPSTAHTDRVTFTTWLCNPEGRQILNRVEALFERSEDWTEWTSTDLVWGDDLLHDVTVAGLRIPALGVASDFAPAMLQPGDSLDLTLTVTMNDAMATSGGTA